MLALPFGLRLVLDRYLPSKQEEAKSATEKFQDMFGDGRAPVVTAERLLRKPYGQWTESEIATEPEMHDWLASHAKSILPWEWSEAAKEKDAAGYGKAWRKLRNELAGMCEDGCGRIGKATKRAQDEVEARTAFVGRMTNQLERLEGDLSTNGLPAAVRLETVERGWLWGYSSKVEKRKVGEVVELGKVIAAEKEKVREQTVRLAQLAQEIGKLDGERRKVEGLKTEVESIGTDGADDLGVVVRTIRRLGRKPETILTKEESQNEKEEQQ